MLALAMVEKFMNICKNNKSRPEKTFRSFTKNC